MECGIIPISQEALMIGDVATGSYSGAVVTAKERKALQKNLGATSKVGCCVIENGFYYVLFGCEFLNIPRF